MTKKKNQPSKFDLDVFFNADAQAIISAREEGKGIHKASNIDASGDQIELPVKEIIKKRLPSKYYVGQGHVVDSNLNNSGQFDIIIADNNGSPILFSSANNTEFFTYESVYVLGEVKSTYYKSKNYVKEYIDKITVVYDELNRNNTPPNQISQDLQLNFGPMIKVESSDKRPYKNPLLKFMFFVNSGDLDVSEIGKLLSAYEPKYLPNFMCFLDKGIIVKAKAEPNIKIPDNKALKDLLNNPNELVNKIFQNSIWDIGEIQLYPEFISADEHSNYKWLLLEFEKEKNSASILAFVIYALNQHLSESVLLLPNLMKYHEKLFM